MTAPTKPECLLLGLRIRELRINRGYSQYDLADRLSVGRTAVSKWERGNNYPEVGDLPEIASVLGVEIGDLFSLFGEGE